MHALILSVAIVTSSSSGAYWQHLPNALQEVNVRTWYTVVASQPKPEPPQRVSVVKNTEVVPSGKGDKYDRVAQCESGMRQDAVSKDGLYLSFFQWLISTWHSVGGEGDPRNHSYAEQKERAMSLSNPSSQWPVCWAKSG
jgi:hypothetical protein